MRVRFCLFIDLINPDNASTDQSLCQLNVDQQKSVWFLVNQTFVLTIGVGERRHRNGTQYSRGLWHLDETGVIAVCEKTVLYQWLRLVLEYDRG